MPTDLDPLMELCLGFFILPHVFCNLIVLLLESRDEFLLAIRPSQVSFKLFSNVIEVVVDVLPLSADVSEDVFVGGYVRLLDVLPQWCQSMG